MKKERRYVFYAFSTAPEDANCLSNRESPILISFSYLVAETVVSIFQAKPTKLH